MTRCGREIILPCPSAVDGSRDPVPECSEAWRHREVERLRAQAALAIDADMLGRWLGLFDAFWQPDNPAKDDAEILDRVEAARELRAAIHLAQIAALRSEARR